MGPHGMEKKYIRKDKEILITVTEQFKERMRWTGDREKNKSFWG